MLGTARRVDGLDQRRQPVQLDDMLGVLEQKLHALAACLAGGKLVGDRPEVIIDQDVELILGEGRDNQVTQRGRVIPCSHRALLCSQISKQNITVHGGCQSKSPQLWIDSRPFLRYDTDALGEEPGLLAI